MEVINLNLIPTGALPVVHASQYDDGRTFRANLMDGSTVYTLDGTEVLECDVKKPDGNIVTVAVTNTSDSYVEIDTTLQMCACAGESLAELHITKGAKEIGSLNFILAVERSPLENGIQSDSAIHNLASQVSAMVATEVANQYDSANVIFDNAPTAGHGNGYAVTSDGLKTAIDAKEDAADVGALTDLTTSDQTSIVNAINEVAQSAPTYSNTASGAIATFESEYELPLRDLEIEINAVQEAGTPTPSSPKAITGFTGANIHVADDENPHVIDNVTSITWQDEAGTVYGGLLDVTTGLLTVTWHAIDLGSLTWTYDTDSIPSNPYFFCQRNTVKELTQNLLCSIYQLANVGVANMPNYSMKSNNRGQVLIVNSDYSDENIFKTAMSGVMLVCEKLTPETYQLTPTEISAIVGTNNVFTDTNGNTSVVYIASQIGDLSTLTTTDKSSLVGAVNEVNAASSDSSITFTPADATKVSLTSLTAYRNGAVLMLNLYLTANTTITANSELQLGTFSGTNASLGAISGAVVNRSNSGLLGSYCFTTGNQRLYANMNSNVASGTNFYLTIVAFT